MKPLIKMTLVLLISMLIIPLATGLAEDNGHREILLPELGIAFTLPEGFGENVADPEMESAVFRSVNAEAGYELSFDKGSLLNASKPTAIDKIKNSLLIWEEVVYGEYQFLIFRAEGYHEWLATIVFEDYYTPLIKLAFSEPHDDPFLLTEEILSSVRFINDNEAKRIRLLYER